MQFDATKESFTLIDLEGHICLFTNMRIDRSTIPEGLYCYDVRDSDFCDGSFAEIQPFVFVNHWGTIICKEELPMNSEWGTYIPENEPTFLCFDAPSIYEFLKMTSEQIFKQYIKTQKSLSDQINEASQKKSDHTLQHNTAKEKNTQMER